MRYVMARINAEHRDMIYRFYVTKALEASALNTSGDEKSMVMTRSFLDIMMPKPEESRTGEEIIDSIKRKLEE